ncbi:Uncharacterised protein [Escherichia coli]|nr:Uncharacterised protein [Escherichia coli]
MTPLQFIGIGKYDLFCMEQSSGDAANLLI